MTDKIQASVPTYRETTTSLHDLDDQLVPDGTPRPIHVGVLITRIHDGQLQLLYYPSLVIYKTTFYSIPFLTEPTYDLTIEAQIRNKVLSLIGRPLRYLIPAYFDPRPNEPANHFLYIAQLHDTTQTRIIHHGRMFKFLSPNEIGGGYSLPNEELDVATALFTTSTLQPIDLNTFVTHLPAWFTRTDATGPKMADYFAERSERRRAEYANEYDYVTNEGFECN